MAFEQRRARHGEAPAFIRDAQHGGDACIDFPFGGQDGYGVVMHESKPIGAHRLALFFATGEWGDTAAHSCDNKRCVNFEHLRWTDKSGNERDKWRDPAKMHHNATLTEDEVRLVRLLLAQGDRHSTIAHKMGVKRHVVADISSGRKYARVN